MTDAEINGLSLYDEHGSGEPLILLHGCLGSGGMFGPVLAELAKSRRVITVDVQGHGRTADVDRPIRMMGYSLGGTTATDEKRARACSGPSQPNGRMSPR